jgi:hypothetical protein
MHDAGVVCRLQRLGDLPANRYRLVQRNGSAPDPFGEIFALDQLHDDGA